MPYRYCWEVVFGKFCVIFSVVVCVTTSQLFVFLRLVIPMLLVRVLLLVTWSQAVAAWSQVVWLRAKAVMSGPGFCDGVWDSSSLAGTVPLQSSFSMEMFFLSGSASSGYLHTWFVSCNGSSSVPFHETFLIISIPFPEVSDLNLGTVAGSLFFFRGFT